ncbi:MAG: diacylglycerol kinase family lipid kinase [Alphaproteobacteria bacterium]
MKGARLPGRRRILVVANPIAGSCRRSRLDAIVDRLRMLGCSVDLHETTARGDAERAVAAVDAAAFDVIAAAGGDGTFNEVLNGLPEGGPPLAVIPLGTANVLAREIALPRSIEGIAETLAFGPCRRVSIGEANGRRFIMMASVGFDAIVVDHVDLELKRRIGKLAYLIETLKQYALAAPSIYHLRMAGREHGAGGVVIANGHFYGGSFVTSPTADLEKPCLDICRLTRSGRLALSRYLASLLLGRLAARADVRIDEATDLEILGPEGAPLQADGDVLCRLPAKIRILPAAVDLVFPAGRPDRRISW